MIEVEKKFQPTEAQLAKLLEGALFLGEKELHDIYFDFPDYRNFKQGIRLRKRNNGYELKVESGTGICEEIEDESAIRKYFAADASLQEFVDKNLVEIINYKNTRQKYTKDGFAIDVDSMDYGYRLVEIELLVADGAEVKEAEEKILAFATRHGFEIKKVTPKGKEYFRIKKPKIYQELYG